MSRVLIIADMDGATLTPAFARVVCAALQIGGDIDVLVAGADIATAAQSAASIQGVNKVIACEAAHYGDGLAEELAPLIAHVAPQYSHVVMAASTTGRDVLPRVAGMLDVAMLTAVTAIHSTTSFTRPIYAGNILETVTLDETPALLSIRTVAFEAAETGGNAPVEAMQPLPPVGLSRRSAYETSSSARPELTSARVVIAGGRGVGAKEHFALLERVADKLGAAIGASRAAVDAGYVPNDWQVGQTGKIVAPELYIAVGISGAIQHLAGMKDSRVIVAINSDENAPIFKLADYGLVADLHTALPELEALL